jgi:hypothetical protein
MVWYLGITSYENREPLFDVRRPAFLKAADKEAQVRPDPGNIITNLAELRRKYNEVWT